MQDSPQGLESFRVLGFAGFAQQLQLQNHACLSPSVVVKKESLQESLTKVALSLKP